MLGRFRFNDEALHGDDGTFDSRFVVITYGLLVPLVMLGLAAYVAWDGGITIRGRHGAKPVRYEGVHAILGVAGFLGGIALILFAKYFLPNVYRTSYRYQYWAAAGAALSFLGMVWFVVSAMA